MAAHSNRPNIGEFRRIRLKPNAQGYYEVWWTDHAAGSVTRRQSTKTKDPVEAQAYLVAFCDDARAGTAQAAAVTVTAASAVPTVEALCERWLAHAHTAGKTAKGIKYILAAIGRELGGYTAGYLATGAGAALLQDYIRRRGRSNGTIRRELGALQTVLRWAARPSVGLIVPGDVPSFDGLMPPQGAPRTKFLDPVQEQRFWDQAMAWGHRTHGNRLTQEAAYRVMVFIALGLETSARCEAIMELTWDRVDLSLGTIDYRVPGRRVTKKRRVRVPISDRLMPVLQEARLRGQGTGPVLDGTRHLRRGFVRFTAAIGMAWVTPHVLRHSWASLAAMNGVSLYDIAQVMGDTVATIEATYLHLTPGHLKTAINHKARAA